MKIGIIYPQTEFGQTKFGSDPVAIRDFAQTAEGLGFSHLMAFDHVVGANPQRPGGWNGPYTYKHAFQEPLVLFGFLAGVTEKIGFTTGIAILPQRQTVLFAKQAATLDVLSGGRLRLGVGLGWNPLEYQALNEDFHNRGKRIEEQVTVLRLLWTQPLVDYRGKWHTLPDVGINPLPVQRPIPLWFGGHAEPVVKRAALIGDGWMPTYRTPAEARPWLDKLERYLEEAGRSRAGFGVEVRLAYGDGGPQAWAHAVRDWQAAGATHLTFNTMRHGFDSPAKHLTAVHRFAEAVGLG